VAEKDRTPEQLVEQAKAVAIELCTAQTGGMEMVAKDVARSIAERLTNDPNLTHAVLRLLAVGVNFFANAVLEFVPDPEVAASTPAVR
jgi:hypothetical protein